MCPVGRKPALLSALIFPIPSWRVADNFYLISTKPKPEPRGPLKSYLERYVGQNFSSYKGQKQRDFKCVKPQRNFSTHVSENSRNWFLLQQLQAYMLSPACSLKERKILALPVSTLVFSPSISGWVCLGYVTFLGPITASKDLHSLCGGQPDNRRVLPPGGELEPVVS